MARNYYSSGSWNLICDCCGKKIKASEAKKRWDGLIVCEDDWESRHPQDFVKAKQDHIIVPYTRPVGTDVFSLREGVYESVDITDSIVTTSTYYRTLSDTCTITDSFSKSEFVSPTDTFSFTDSTSKGINPVYTDTVTLTETNYFSEQYLVNNDDYVLPSFLLLRQSGNTDLVGIQESIGLTTQKSPSDSFTFSDSGVITLPAYISATYFASDYMQTTQSF